MKAIRIVEPGKVETAEIPDPPSPGSGEVRLRVRRVGYCGSDLASFRGLNPLVGYPRVPGHEIAAVIEETGSGVPDGWRPGVKVLASPYRHCGRCAACRKNRPNACRENRTLGVQRDGALCQWIVLPHERLFTSESLDFAAMALVEPLTIGFHAVDRGAVDEADTVAVFGCGAIGLGVVAGAAARRARVIAIDVDDAKLALARRCGAGETIHSRREDLGERLRELTGGEGPDVAIEAAGLPETFRACVEEAGFCGRVVYIGYAKSAVEYETKFFVMKELDIRGSRNAVPGDFLSVIRYLESGAFPVDEAVTRTVPFEEGAAALAAWDKAPENVTRIHVALE